MLLPKKLIASTDREILREVADELNIPITHVNRTFELWIKHLKNISDNTDQASINLPRLGTMYISYARLKGNDDLEWEKKKIDHIEASTKDAKLNDHKSMVPISIIYGTGRKNYRAGKNIRGYYDFFTKEELIRRQNNAFFNEDFEFRDRKDVYEEFFNDIEEQQVENYEYPKNIKSENKEQEQTGREEVV